MKKEKSERARGRNKKSEKEWERQEGNKENLLKIDRGDKRQKVEEGDKGRGATERGGIKERMRREGKEKKKKEIQ